MRIIVTLFSGLFFCINIFGQTIVASGPTTFCAGDNVTLSVNPVTSITSYRWVKDGVDITGATNPSYTVNTSGSYTVKLTRTSPKADTIIGPQVVTVNPIPPLPTFTISTNNQCASVPFSFVIDSPLPGAVYTWDFGDLAVGTGLSISHVYNAIGNGTKNFTVKVALVSSAGCSAALVSQVVSMKEKPDASLSDFTNTPAFTRCASSGSSTLFDLKVNNSTSTSNTNSLYTIDWGDNSTLFSSTNFSSETHTYNSLGYFTIKHTVTGQNGCITTTPYTVYNGSNPGIGLSSNGSTIQQCIPATDTFFIDSARFKNNPPGTTYTVSFNDGSPNSVFSHPPPLSFVHTFNSSSCGAMGANNPNSFFVRIRAQNPCGFLDGGVEPITTVTPPNADFAIAPDSDACLNQIVTFSNTTENGSIVSLSNQCINTNIINWEITPSSGWTINSGSLGISNPSNNPAEWGSENLKIIFNTPGNYSIKLIARNAANNGLPCRLDSIIKSVCITTPPIPGFSLDNSTGCTPFNISVTNLTTFLNCKNPTYKWTITYAAAFCGTSSSFTFTNGTSDTSSNPSINFTNPGKYTITQNVTNACGTFTSSKTIDIRKAPTVSINLPVYSCGAVNITPSSTVDNCSSTVASYAWTFTDASPANASTANPGNISFTTVGIHPISLAVTNECGTTTDLDTVVVSVAPDVQAPADATVCGGTTAGPYNFTNTVGSPNFNWANNNPSIGLPANGTGNIAAFTAINNTAAPITARIIVTPAVSNCAGVPDTFFITVNPQPAAPTVIPSFTYCQDEPAASLTATGTGGNTFTWYNNPALTGGSAIPPVPSTSSAGVFLFYVTQTNSFSCASTAAIITVNVNPRISGNIIGSSQNICANTAPNPLTAGTVNGGNGNYLYQWQSSINGGASWTNVVAGTTNTYAPGLLSDTIQYRRIVNSVSCSDTSNIITINVAGALTNYNIAANQEICEGMVPLPITGQSPNGGGGNYTYQWQSTPIDNINWANAAGASTGQDYQPPALSVSTYLRRIVTTPQCSAISNAVAVTVNPTPAGNITAVDPFICVEDAGRISFTASMGQALFNISLLTVSPAAVTDTVKAAINGNGPAAVQVIDPGSAPGIYSVHLVSITDTHGCINLNISTPVTIAVLNPIINTIEKDTTICNGQSFTIQSSSLSGGDAPGRPAAYTYQWESTPAGQANWQPVPGATTAALTVTPAASTCYRRKVKSNGKCEVISNSVCVTVDPGISNNTIAASQQVCVNTAVANLVGSTPSGGNGNYAYTWFTSTDSLTWSLIANSVSYQPPIYTVAGVHYFRRDVSSGNCTSSSNRVTIRVRPDSKAAFTANPTTSCAPFNLAAAIVVSVLPDNNGTYNWYADGTLFGSNSTGIFPGYTISNAADTVTIKLVTNSQYGCKPDSTEQVFITPRTAIARFTKDKTSGCGPLDVTFTNTSDIINNNIRFFWNFGNGITSTDAQPGTVTFNTSPYFNDTTYQISLKAYNGCDTTVWKDSVKVRSNPNARFGVATTFGCSPFTVQVNNTSLGGPNIYYWDFGNGHRDTTFANGPLNYTYNTGNTTDTFPIRLTAVNECGIDTQTINIRIAPNVIRPQVNINASDLFGCAPHIVAFNNATSGATSYTWDFNDGTPAIITNNTEATVLHSFDNPGIYTVSVFMTNGCSDTSITRQVTVFAKPIAAFTTTSNIYCLGDTIRVNNNSQNASNYRWFWGDGQSSAGSNPTHVYATAGDYTILLRAEKTNNSGVVCYDTLTKNITLLVRPDARIQTNVGNINCAPFTMDATAPGIINESVTWYITDSTVSSSAIVQTGINTQYTFNKPGTFTVKMIAQNALQCSDSSSITFTVRGTPVASFIPGSLNICKTDTTITYTNTTTFNDNGPLNYRWLVNGVQQSVNGNFTYHYTTPANTILPRSFTTLLVASNTVGCSDTAQAILQMNPVAKAQFSISNTNTCVPFVLPVTDASQYTSSRKWLVNGVLVDTAVNPVLTITQAAMPYRITLVADNIYGCKPDTFSINFTTRSRPVASFILNDTLGCTGKLNVVTNNRSTNANFYTWDWGDNSGTTTISSPTHLYTINGAYLITLVASDGTCRDTTEQLVKVSVKPVADFDADNKLDCDTTPVNFTNLTQNGYSYTWYFGDGSTSIETNPFKAYPPRPVPYTVKLVADNGLGCKDSITKTNLITAKVPPPGDFFISPTPVISYPNYTFSFNNLTPNSANYTYQWNLGDGTFANTRDVINHKYADTGNYSIQLVVLDAASQCLDTTTKIARIDGFPGFLYVPNAICPGCMQTGLREFIPKGKGLAQYRLQIFTTWGELVFETSSLDADGAPNKSWDARYKGQLVQQDVYVWRIDAKFKNGTEWLGMLYPGESKYKKAGTITVVK